MSVARPTYRLVDWPLGEGEDDGGEYPHVTTFTDREQAIERAKELVTEYAASRASVEIDANGHGHHPDLSAFTESAIELGRFDESADYYDKPWELDTGRETVRLTIEKTTETEEV